MPTPRDHAIACASYARMLNAMAPDRGHRPVLDFKVMSHDALAREQARASATVRLEALAPERLPPGPRILQAGTAQTLRPGSRIERIYRWAQQHGGWFTTQDVAAAFGCTATQAATSVGSLAVERRLLERRPTGLSFPDPSWEYRIRGDE